MRIGLNYTPYIEGKVGGMGVYMKSFLQYIGRIAKNDKIFVVCFKKYKKELAKYGATAIVVPQQEPGENLSNLLLYVIQLYKFDIWFCPLLSLDPINCPIPAGVNIPDMQHKYFPEYFDPGTLKWREENYQKSVDKCGVVLTLSEVSRNDIIRFLNVDINKVTSVHLACPPWYISKNIDRNNKWLERGIIGKDKYLLYPANFWPHKNHIRLLEAIATMDILKQELKLVLTGYPYDKFKQMTEIIDRLDLKNTVVNLGYVEDKEMPSLYSNAMGLVFPSLFEGFGIPLLEAMQCNCPIVCSNTTSIPEIAGKASLMFDPLSVKDMKNKIEQFINNTRLRKNLVRLGRIQIRKFNYYKTVKKTYLALKSIAKSNNKERVVFSTGMVWPKISIITPSFNQGKYIERTIRSVLDQKYPNLEYLVMDGRSTGKTIDILKKYSQKITWVSEKDKGQTDAINKGLRRSTGEILAYLNSDDTYEPNAFMEVVNFFKKHPEEVFVYGKGRHIDQNDDYLEDYPNGGADYEKLHGPCPICQPTAFWNRKVITKVGLFDEKLNYAMDYDYWIRISKQYNLNFIDQYLANTRFYPETKTSGKKIDCHREIINTQLRHYKSVNQHWIFALVHSQLSSLNRTSIVGNSIFNSYLVGKSLYYSLLFNKRLPDKEVLKLYYLWLKQIPAFIVKRRFKTVI